MTDQPFEDGLFQGGGICLCLSGIGPDLVGAVLIWWDRLFEEADRPFEVCLFQGIGPGLVEGAPPRSPSFPLIPIVFRKG